MSKPIFYRCDSLTFDETVLERLNHPFDLGGALISLAVDAVQQPRPGVVVMTTDDIVTTYDGSLRDVLGVVCGGSWAKQ